MIKIIAAFPIFLITLFIPSNINASIINSNNVINNNYKNSNLLISYGGGGGGRSGGSGNSPKAKAKREARKERIKLIFKKKTGYQKD